MVVSPMLALVGQALVIYRDPRQLLRILRRLRWQVLMLQIRLPMHQAILVLEMWLLAKVIQFLGL